MSYQIDDIIARLDQISEELADLAMSRLRDSIEAGDDSVPVDEKIITRSRRAVEKARTLLQTTQEGGSEYFGL